jgi:hypothetical protein
MVNKTKKIEIRQILLAHVGNKRITIPRFGWKNKTYAEGNIKMNPLEIEFEDVNRIEFRQDCPKLGCGDTANELSVQDDCLLGCCTV